jgi:hypothetical protein
MRIIDWSETSDMLKEVIAGREKYVYARPVSDSGQCYNVELRDGKYVGSCIVGTLVVDKLGIDAESIYYEIYCEHGLRKSGSDAMCNWLEDVHDISFTPSARTLLAEVQESQDSGIAWGEAVSPNL